MIHPTHTKDNACVDKCEGCIHRSTLIWIKHLFFCRICYRPDVQWNHLPPCPRYESSPNRECISNKKNKIINTFVEDSSMKSICDIVQSKLNEYGYRIYQINKTANDEEFCIMTESMMIFVNENDKSLTLSFECNLEPEKVGQNIMIINEIEEVNLLFISESYMFDKNNKKYIIGNEAKELAFEVRKTKVLREITKEQMYCNLLLRQKCFEC